MPETLSKVQIHELNEEALIIRSELEALPEGDDPRRPELLDRMMAIETRLRVAKR